MYLCGIQDIITMQGRKELTPKMLYQVHIGDLVPKDNFYRILNKELNLGYLYSRSLISPFQAAR